MRRIIFVCLLLLSMLGGSQIAIAAPVAQIQIPKLRLSLPLVETWSEVKTFQGRAYVDWAVPFGAVAHIPTTAQAGEIGNAVYYGHSNLIAPQTFGRGVFADLWTLTVGDEIIIQLATGQKQGWRVVESFAVQEEGVSFDQRAQNAQAILHSGTTPTLTLITCWNGIVAPLSGSRYRWVVRAVLATQAISNW